MLNRGWCPSCGEGEPVDRQDTINFRRRRRHTESVEGVKRCVSKSGCCATPLVSERGVEFSPRVRPSGITRGYAWYVPSGDSGWTMSYFFSYQEKQTLWRSVYSLSCGLICRAQKYNKGVSWRNKDVSWQPYCIFRRYKDIFGESLRFFDYWATFIKLFISSFL